MFYYHFVELENFYLRRKNDGGSMTRNRDPRNHTVPTDGFPKDFWQYRLWKFSSTAYFPSCFMIILQTLKISICAEKMTAVL